MWTGWTKWRTGGLGFEKPGAGGAEDMTAENAKSEYGA
jgi:hypothetical protein